MRLLTPRLLLISIILLFTTPCFAASRLEIGANDATGWVNFSQTITSNEMGEALLNGRFLRNVDENTTLGSVGFNVYAPIAAIDGLQLGGGVKGYAASSEKEDIISGALGVLAEYFPPVLKGVGVSGEVFYGPDIFTGRDADNILESNVRLAYRLSTMAEFFVDYSNIRVDLDKKGTRSLEESVSIGMAFSF